MASKPDSSQNSLKGKRKKKMPANANPLFSQWLREWKDEANEKGWKSAHTYAKALKTLELFPVPLESGKDCKLLRNFGDKICKMLDEKLAQYKQNGGVLPSSSHAKGLRGDEVQVTSVSSSIVGVSSTYHTSISHGAQGNRNAARNVPTARPGKRKGAANGDIAGSPKRQGSAHTISDDSGSDKELQETPQKKKSRSKGPREYVPAYRSGPYALILALFRTMRTAAWRGYMLKADLIESAQPLSDKSFTIPDPGSHYTAWSSMGTLIRKGIIIKYSNPAKFLLTEQGQELAERLEAAENGDRAVQPVKPHSSRVKSTSRSSSQTSDRSNPSPLPGSQTFSTGDADLDAALNASLHTGYVPDLDISNSNDYDINDAHHQNRSMNNRLHMPSQSSLDISIEDTDLEAALKASLEMSRSQGSSVSKTSAAPERDKHPSVPNFNTEDTDLEAALKLSLKTDYTSRLQVGKSTMPHEKNLVQTKEKMEMSDIVDEEENDLKAALEASLVTSSPSISTDNINDKQLQNYGRHKAKEHVEKDTDFKAALKASLESHSRDSETSLEKSSDPPEGDTDWLHNASISPNVSLNRYEVARDESDEDEDLKRAIAESLLSHSQEISKSQCSVSDHEQAGRSDSDIEKPNLLIQASENDKLQITSGNDSVFIVSDDEGDDKDLISVSRKVIQSPASKRNVHSFSPSPPPSIKSKTAVPSGPKPPRLILPSSEMFTNITPKYSMDSVSTSSTINNNMKEDIVIIAEDDETGVVKQVRKTIAEPPPEDSDDDLPDLDIPLYQRLLNKGKIRSDLLKDVKGDNYQQESAKPVVESHRSGSDRTASCLRMESHDVPGSSESVYEPCSTEDKKVTKKVPPVSQKGKRLISKESSNQSNSTTSYSSIASSKNNSCTVNEDSKDSSAYTESMSHPTAPVEPPPAITVPECAPEFTFPPGTFDIVLCLDNREFYGSKSNSKTLLPDLMKSGVQCDLRLLHVGDLLWVARERASPQLDSIQRVQGKEVVLNYIVERKRMDDLVSSLTDGRMKEQKFRLKHCGLSETIILIEEYGSIQNFSLSEDRIKQSIVNSQMIDGFKVKRCGGTKEAVAYLTLMTRFLQRQLRNKTLHAVPVEQMKLMKGHQNLSSKELYLAEFSVFNEAAVKHKDLTVTELFGKQLIQVPGVSAERAKAITNVYPTLGLLMDAYKKCTTEKESEKLLATIKYGKNDRNLGIAVSRTLYMLYTKKDALS